MRYQFLLKTMNFVFKMLNFDTNLSRLALMRLRFGWDDVKIAKYNREQLKTRKNKQQQHQQQVQTAGAAAQQGNGGFYIKPMNSVLNMMNYLFKIMNSVLNMMNHLFKIMNCHCTGQEVEVQMGGANASE